MSREEIKNALRIIKEECNRNYNCDSCMFKQLTGGNCMEIVPCKWTFKEDRKIRYCYRCGEEITGQTAYFINVLAFGSPDGGITTDGEIENILNNIQPEKYLCQKCKNKIKRFINNPTVKEVDENVD